MRSGIKLLSRSTRRQLVRRRPLSMCYLSESQGSRAPLGATETSFGKFNDSTTASQSHPFTESTRYFASAPTSGDGDFEQSDNAFDKIDFDQDFDSHNFDDDNDKDDDDDEEPDKDRIWMDPESPLEQRVDRFVNQPLGSIHHLDIKLTSLDLIKACGKLNSFEGMKRAQEILDRLIEEKKYVNNSEEYKATVVIPDRPFKMVMYGWANLCRKVKFAPQRMREVLDLMTQEAEYDKKTRDAIAVSRIQDATEKNSDDNTHEDNFAGLSCEPTVDIYNTLLQGLSLAAKRSIQAAIEAEQALSKMDKMHRNRGWHTKPNTRSYSLVLNAYANSKHATAGDRAEGVLRDMMERHVYEKEEYLEEYGIEYNVSDDDLNERKIVTPDTIAYTMVIQAHGSSDSAASADRALLLLNELIESENPKLQPDSFCFASTIHAFAKMAARKKNPGHRFEAAERAEEILWILVDELQKNPNLKASIVPFNACLNAWAQSFTPESPYRAEKLLHKLLDPELQSVTQIQPNTVSFNTCMQAWSKACKFEETAAPTKAEEFLELLVKLSEEDPESKLKPDLRSFATVMNAYALSQQHDSVTQTRRLLMDLIQNGRGNYFETNHKDKMNAHPFTIVLKAAANTKNKDESSSTENLDDDLAFGGSDDTAAALDDPYTIALETYSDLLNDSFELNVSPDHFAFAEMLNVIAKHTSSESIERRQRIEEIFGDACNAGQVSSLVVKAMQNACPNEIVSKELLRLRGSVASIESINQFPRQWTSRVPQEFRRVSSRKDHFQKQSNYFRAKNEQGNKHANRHKSKGKRRSTTSSTNKN